MFSLPSTAEFLSVAVVSEQPVIFVLHRYAGESIVPARPRIIRIARTGERFNSQYGKFIGTLCFNIGHTFHVFEQPEGIQDEREERFQPDYEEVAATLRDA